MNIKEIQVIENIIFNIVNNEPLDEFEIDKYDEWRDLHTEWETN